MTRQRINQLNEAVFNTLHNLQCDPALAIEKYRLAEDVREDALSVNRSWGYYPTGTPEGGFVAGPLS